MWYRQAHRDRQSNLKRPRDTVLLHCVNIWTAKGSVTKLHGGDDKGFNERCCCLVNCDCSCLQLRLLPCGLTSLVLARYFLVIQRLAQPIDPSKGHCAYFCIPETDNDGTVGSRNRRSILCWTACCFSLAIACQLNNVPRFPDCAQLVYIISPLI